MGPSLPGPGTRGSTGPGGRGTRFTAQGGVATGGRRPLTRNVKGWGRERAIAAPLVGCDRSVEIEGRGSDGRHWKASGLGASLRCPRLPRAWCFGVRGAGGVLGDARRSAGCGACGRVFNTFHVCVCVVGVLICLCVGLLAGCIACLLAQLIACPAACWFASLPACMLDGVHVCLLVCLSACRSVCLSVWQLTDALTD